MCGRNCTKERVFLYNSCMFLTQFVTTQRKTAWILCCSLCIQAYRLGFLVYNGSCTQVYSKCLLHVIALISAENRSKFRTVTCQFAIAFNIVTSECGRKATILFLYSILRTHSTALLSYDDSFTRRLHCTAHVKLSVGLQQSRPRVYSKTWEKGGNEGGIDRAPARMLVTAVRWDIIERFSEFNNLNWPFYSSYSSTHLAFFVSHHC